MDIKLKIMFASLVLVVIFLAVFVALSYRGFSQKLSGGGDAAGSGSYRVFVGENGKYGVRNTKDEEIIPSQWNNIMMLNGGRFIVENSVSLKGIIDAEQNVLLPFICESTTRAAQNLLIISTTDGKYLICNASGELLSDKLWDSCVYDEGKFSMKSGTCAYTAQIDEDGVLDIQTVSVTRRMLGTSVLAVFSPARGIPGIDSEDYIEVIHASFSYIEALFSDEARGADRKVGIFKDRLLNGNVLKSAFEFHPVISMDNGIIRYVCSFRISYYETADDGQNSEIEMNQSIELEFSRTADGDFFVSDVR